MLSVSIPAVLSRLVRLAVLAAGLAAMAGPAGAQDPGEGRAAENRPEGAAPPEVQELERIERALQGLSWEQFRSVVAAIPKLKADVDAYGPLGWQYVQANYRTYPWRKSIRKLQEPQRKRLSELIDEARSGRLTAR